MNPLEVASISRFPGSVGEKRRTRVNKSRRIIVSATGRERGFAESLAAFPEKREGKRAVVVAVVVVMVVVATTAATAAREERREGKEGR